MLHAALAALTLAFAPPQGGGQPTGDAAPTQQAAGDVAEAAGEPQEAQIDPAVLTMLGGFSPEAQERFGTLDDAALNQLVQRYIGRQTLDPVDAEIAEGYVALIVAQQDAELSYQTGDIALQGGLATLHLGDGFRYLDPEGARKVLVDFWANPPEAANNQLGMIVPADLSPAHPLKGWGAVISYTEDGHVEDDDAEDIDYDELLEQMQEDTREANPERVSRGYPEMTLVGWAEPPHYDGSDKRLYWAQELSTQGDAEHSLNYAIRVLGRKGVIEVNAIAGMSQLDEIGPEMERVLATVEFEQGNRYEDFDPDIDKVAAYGIAGLVAGKLLAKAGLFAILLKFLIVAKKFLIVGVIAVGVFFKKLFSRRKPDADA